MKEEVKEMHAVILIDGRFEVSYLMNDAEQFQWAIEKARELKAAGKNVRLVQMTDRQLDDRIAAQPKAAEVVQVSKVNRFGRTTGVAYITREKYENLYGSDGSL